MKATKTFRQSQRKSPAWNRKQWVLAVLIAFVIIMLFGLIIFFFFPNKAI